MNIRSLLGRVARRIRSIPRRSGALSQALVARYRRLILALRVRHIHGELSIDHAPDELVLTCVVRNGSSYIKAFVEHYRAMGVKHIVFLDNGSTDDTIKLASSYEKVTVLSVDVPYSHYENFMKDYLARRFSKGRWNLTVDIDELFDYVGSDVVALGQLLRYLDSRGFTAVVAQMLDLFSDWPLSHIPLRMEDDLKSNYVYCDLSEIEQSPYRWSKLSSDGVRMHHGGIRKTLFGTNNGLTKAPLVFVSPRIRLFRDWHHAENAHVADFTSVLLHYPFNGSFYAKVKEAAESKRYGHFTSDEYDLYWRRLSKDPDLSFRVKTARRFTGTSALLEEGFLVASPEYFDLLRPPDGTAR
jgi:glycosyltransferase involved in cell wall biosynthesis